MLLIRDKFIFFIIGLAIFCLSLQTFAAKHGLIISCRAGNAQLHRENKNYSVALLNILQQKDFTNIDLFFEGGNPELKGSQDIERATIIETLNKLSKKLQSTDQLWLFLLGHSSASPRRVSLATKNGRLTGKQLATLLDKIPAEQFIFCLNSQSHGLMQRLAKPNRMVLCATDSYKQLNPPRFTELFINSWNENKNNNLLDIVKKAGALTENSYKSNNLASAENSQIYYKGKILSYPFDGSERQWLNIALPKTISERDKADEKIAFKPELEGINIHPATPASRAQLAKAKQQATKYAQHPAVYIKRNIELTLKHDNSSSVASDEAIYLNRETAAAVFGRLKIGVIAGSTSKINCAKVIYPDGSYADFKELSKDFSKSITFSGLRQGCLLLRALSVNVPAPKQLPDYNKNLQLQSSFPIVTSQVKLNVPKNSHLRYKLYNSQIKPLISVTEYSKIYLFKIASIPAYSYLPGDPDRQKILIHLALSTMKSWENFAIWAKRMFHRADKVDPATEKFLDKLVNGAENDTEKVKRIYDFLCELRYLTVPVGAAAFRPRLPGVVISSRYGDCKDKANALVVLAGQLGIKSYRVLLNRGHWTDKTFPAWQFNHMLVYFPKLSGYPAGLWLDPTDGSTRFGTLPPGDIGRTGMVIQDNKFEFKTIKLSGNIPNSIERNIKLKLQQDTSELKGTVRITFSGLTDYKMRKQLKRLSPRQLKFFIQNRVATFLPNFTVTKFTTTTAISNLSVPLKIIVEIKGAWWMLNNYKLSLANDLWTQFSFQKRKYGIIINDRQGLSVKQTLTVTGLFPLGLGQKQEWNSETNCVAINFSEEQTTSLVQKFEYKLKSGVIPTDQYEKIRDIILKFKKVMNFEWKKYLQNGGKK